MAAHCLYGKFYILSFQWIVSNGGRTKEWVAHIVICAFPEGTPHVNVNIFSHSLHFKHQ